MKTAHCQSDCVHFGEMILFFKMKFTELLNQKCTNGQNGIELEKVNESIEQSIETLCGRIGEGSVMLLADIYCDIYCAM